ncbi:MAG: C1 family peptidase [Planctomycetota bacterium]
MPEIASVALRPIRAVAVLALAATLTAQTGSIDPTPAQLDSIAPFVAPRIELIEEGAVDLRPWLPAVGEQRMNDCTCWAIGYAAKSYLEARDQGWRPDTPEHLFSPRFLYNQINHGEDRGSSFVDAIRVMREIGAATLATSPYRPGDPLGAPDEVAFAEARAFPIVDGFLCADRIAIRRALQRRQVVVFGAEVGPLFLSGRFTRYDPAAFARDEAMRQPGQPHGKHAMCIVGYDDRAGCFLIQNSWGPRWCEHGYAWLQYELFDEIRIAAAGEGVFCNWAVTLLDVEEKVARGDDGLRRPLPLDLGTLSVRGFCDAIDFDPARKGYVYTFVADLRGQTAALDAVRSVRWFWTDAEGKPRAVDCDTRANSFGIVGSTNLNPSPVHARLFLRDGSEARELDGALAGPVPKADFRSAGIRFEDEYWGRLDGDGTTPLFEWSAQLDVPLQDRAQITEVRWQVGKLSRTWPEQVGRGLNGPAWQERALGMTDVTDRLEAEIHYSDGGVKTVSLAPTLDDAVRDEPVIESEYRALGTSPDGRTLYAFTLGVDLPRRHRLEIDHVDWELDPWLAGHRQTDNQGTFKWSIHGQSDRDFRARATLCWTDGRKQGIESWIELGADARYADDDHLALRADDSYLGRIDGEPVFRTTFRLVGDSARIAQVRDVVFGSDWQGRSATWKRQPTDGLGPSLTLDQKGERRVTVDLLLDGRARHLEIGHRPRSEVDDRISVGLTQAEEVDTTIDREHGSPAYAKSLLATVRMPDRERNRIVGVQWRHTLFGRQERETIESSWLNYPGLCDLRTVVTERSRLSALVTTMDGFVEHVECMLDPTRVRTAPAELSLRVREKYEGHDDEGPVWRAKIGFVGRAEAIGAVSGIEARTRPAYATDAGEEELRCEAQDTLELMVREPTELECTFHLNDGSTTRCAARIHADAPVIDDLAAQILFRPFPDPDRPERVACVVGVEGLMQSVVGVKWLRDDGSVICAPPSREDGDLTGFACVLAPGTELPRHAEIEFADGHLRRIAVGPEPARAKVTRRVAVRPFADGLYEVEIHPIGDALDLSCTPRDAWCPVVVDGEQQRGDQVPLHRGFTRRFLLPSGSHAMPAQSLVFRRPVDLAAETLEIAGAFHGPLALRLDRAHTLDGATPMLSVVRIEGDEGEVSKVAAVHYRIDGAPAHGHRVDDRFAGGGDGFALRRRMAVPTRIEATVQFQDGTSRSLLLKP